MIQFHQAYSYEDFMGGYRPAVINGGAGFEFRPGVFARFCESAKLAPNEKFVFIIDEINRGNLSKIFGETMLLIEPDKRGPGWGIELTYSSKTDPAFFIPQNVFLLGLMNTADRSLAMVDYALRRRFAFMTLPPAFSTPKFRTHLESRGVSIEVRKKLINGMEALNAEIEKDKDLGKGFLVGHSFFSSPPSALNDGGEEWLRRVVETELRPLLREYWFDKSEEDIDSKLGTLIG
jgi:5-methylcytosine-specific restriction endonuclease McrBC GTP-binding regulatory subunit McrB